MALYCNGCLPSGNDGSEGSQFTRFALCHTKEYQSGKRIREINHINKYYPCFASGNQGGIARRTRDATPKL